MKIKLTKEERELSASIDRGEWKSVKNVDKEILRHRAIARNTLRKDARINIRLTRHDLTSLKTKAVREGMPYQTLVASILHKYLTGQLISHG